MNVILILADQLSAKWLGCYGNPAAVTPNLDALARRGARFENCIVNNPVCMPSRASMITGRSAQHHGVYYNGYELGLDLPTFPQELQRAGFQTFGVGKFHLECHGRSAHNDVTKYGFERAETTEDIRVGDWLDWVRWEHPEHAERALATCWSMPHLAKYGSDGEDLRPLLARAKESHPRNWVTFLTYESLVPEDVCQTHWVVERSIAFLEERDRGQPFFLQASFVDPHDPYDPPARFLDLVDADRIPAPVGGEDPALSAILERFRRAGFVGRFDSMSDRDWRAMRRHYLASLAFIDAEVGRLMAYLEATGLDRETRVLFTSDHGDMLGDHGLPTKGAWHFDACVRVPLLAWGPGVKPTVSRNMVTNLDLYPTIMDLAGAACEAPLEGDSLTPILTGDGAPDRPDAALVETFGSYAVMDPDCVAKTVRTPDAAFTLFGDEAGMLFDLSADPDERVNLCGREEARELERRMRDLMLRVEFDRYSPLSNRRRHPTAQH